ncbi:MAG: hypothetical protein M1840_009130 [Geoglossum simile]|nr:MAG: hypothetical protein M1840_009130 [Geoglossum simile]
MPPPPPGLVPRRTFDPGTPSAEFYSQWTRPKDVFSVLLILGGDVVSRALAQLAGGWLTPVAFSFGWVAYAVTALVAAVGENRLMPVSDCPCKVINGKSGHTKDNSSWIIGRIVRDFESWMDPKISEHLDSMVMKKWEEIKDDAELKEPGSGHKLRKPPIAGLCVSIYKASHEKPGRPGHDRIYYTGLATTFIQLGIATTPCILYGDWGVLLVTVGGVLLSFTTGSLPQWSKEKWACRRNVKKSIVLTRGNGSQHAIVILGEERGLDLEDLAVGPINVDVSTSRSTRIVIATLATLWILLLITAAGLSQNTWYLLVVGAIGILQNVTVAGWRRDPSAFGVPLTFEEVIGKTKVMQTLYAVEDKYPGLGRSMVATFFPGILKETEQTKWNNYAAKAKTGATGFKLT